MKGAVFFSSKYGSAAQYANWISQETDLPLHCIKTSAAHPSDYDFLVLVSPVFRFRLMVADWVARNLSGIGTKPVVLVTVSAAPAGPRLDTWIRDSLPPEFVSRVKHIALRGRQDFKGLTFFDRVWLTMAAMKNASYSCDRGEFENFDYVDRSCIGAVAEVVREMQTTTSVPSRITKTDMRFAES